MVQGVWVCYANTPAAILWYFKHELGGGRYAPLSFKKQKKKRFVCLFFNGKGSGLFIFPLEEACCGDKQVREERKKKSP